MIRNTFLLALSASALLSLGGPASAQIVFPNFPQNPPVPFPNIEGLPPEVQKQLEEVFRRAGMPPRGRAVVNDGSLKWGGVRLTKVDMKLQQELGLEEKEGLVVAAVEPNSAADKAGLKASDVLVKINDKSVPNDLDNFTKLLKDQKVEDAADLIVVRKGKEETLKAAKMPALVQANPLGGGRIGQPGLAFPRIDFNPPNLRLPGNPFQPGAINKLHLEMTVNGAKVIRKQDGDQFSGEYSKGDLKITIAGKIENGRAKPGEVTVTEGKETKKYATPKEMPAQHRPLIQQLMPSPLNGMMMFSTIPNLQGLRNFPGVPVIPELDD